MTSTLPPLVQAFSGAIGSASANALTYPLDLVTTRLQLDPPHKARRSSGLHGAVRILRGIIKKHGFQDLYTGLATDTGATLLSNFFYFYFYAGLRYLLTRRQLTLNPKPANLARPHKPSLLEELLLGFIAGVASRAVSTPLNIVTLRLQVENDNDEEEGDLKPSVSGVGGVVKKIYDEQGILGFWRGFKTTTLLSLNPALTLALFQVFRRVLARASASAAAGANPKPSQAFLGAAVSNSIGICSPHDFSSVRTLTRMISAAFILYPLMLAKTRLQASSATSMREVLRDAYTGRGRSAKFPMELNPEGSKQPGIPGLYQGLEMQIIKGFLSQGVTFLVKGRVEQLIVEMYARRRR
ncbi:mitochondrial carrier domain-containing protein [Mycena rosella]|uniref:Mitochondrial carrier domain-containing protein n=1 Tax=Mycena rosella TaxID=1033263 RepID=A0AAD7CQQ0_MYCRO|nr:mitochondrial carrier domain-containing protein [Mycena rosella]